tara:strand:+ start:44 stop:1249 length:1206 start_codon:yes stop_codon:yes gene_type:complete
MCVIIIKQKENKVSRDTLENASEINPDGMGVVWLDTFDVSYHKSHEWEILDTTRPYIAHFRYATVGAVNRDNTHPFVCGKQKNELLMMNGTIKGMGNFIKCDSRVLAEKLGDIPRKKWKKHLAKYSSRFVSINTKTKTFQIYNRHLYTFKDGVWYSKTNVLQNNVIGVYGTLKKGYSNYNWYLTSSRYVGAGKTADRYPLVISGLPYLINEKGVGFNVDIDVFKVSDSVFKDIDSLESHPNWYRREKIPIKMEDGSIVMAWVYFNIQEKVGNRKLHQTYKQSQPKYNYGWGSSWNTWNTPSYHSKPKKDTTWDSWEDTTELQQEDNFFASTPKQIENTDSFLEEWENRDRVISADSNTLVNPHCIDCYSGTLEYDGFNMYYCNACGGWFNEDEVSKHNLYL